MLIQCVSYHSSNTKQADLSEWVNYSWCCVVYFRLIWRNSVARKSIINCGNRKRKTILPDHCPYSFVIEIVWEGKGTGWVSWPSSNWGEGLPFNPYEAYFWQKKKPSLGLATNNHATKEQPLTPGAVSPRKSLKELLPLPAQQWWILTITWGIRDNVVRKTAS